MADYIDQYTRYLERLGRRDATIDTYVGMLRRLDRELKYGLASANADELADAIYTRARRPATRALYRAATRGFFGWATAEDGPLDYDPSVHLPSVRVPARAPRPVTTDVLHDIIARARDPFGLWFLVMAGLGLRCVELAALDREHVTPLSAWVQGKGGKERSVRTPPAVWAAVVDLPSGPIARPPAGGRYTRQQVRNRVNYQLQQVLKVNVSAHRLRHWFGTETYRRGGEFVAQQALGHASPATTAMYAQVASEAMAAAANALPLPRR